MNEPKSPRAPSAFSVIGRLGAKAGLSLLLFLGWSLNVAAKPVFDAGADIETWARDQLARL